MAEFILQEYETKLAHRAFSWVPQYVVTYLTPKIVWGSAPDPEVFPGFGTICESKMLLDVHHSGL